jgi:hypothetical protein
MMERPSRLVATAEEKRLNIRRNPHAAGVGTDLAHGIVDVGTVAHQAGCFHILAHARD